MLFRSLRSNGGGDSGIYESGGLDCIVKSPRADLTDNRLFIRKTAGAWYK